MSEKEAEEIIRGLEADNKRLFKENQKLKEPFNKAFTETINQKLVELRKIYCTCDDNELCHCFKKEYFSVDCDESCPNVPKLFGELQTFLVEVLSRESQLQGKIEAIAKILAPLLELRIDTSMRFAQYEFLLGCNDIEKLRSLVEQTVPAKDNGEKNHE